MKFPNLKKYFFAHITVLLFYLTLIFFICAVWLNKHYPSETYTIYGEPGVFTWSPGDLPMFGGIICVFFGLFAAVFMILEVLLRKFVIKKYFPNLKFPYSIKLPRWLCVMHSIFFYIGFIPMICIDIYFLFFAS